MDSQKRSSRVAIVVITAVTAGVIAGAAYRWNTRNLQPASNVTSSSQTPVAQASSRILLATRVDPTADRSDDSDRDLEYKLSSIDSAALAAQNLDSIRVNIFANGFAYSDGKVYFVNGDGELSAYDLATKKTDRIALPDIKPVFGFLDDHSVNDFILSGTTLTYLQGMCTDGAVCHLRQYDFVTKKMSPIIDRLDKKLLLVGDTTVSLKEYNSTTGTITLLKTRNSGDNGFADLVSVSIQTKQSIVTKTFELTDDEKSTEEEGLFAKAVSCGSAMASQKLVDIPDTGDADIQTTIVSAEGKTALFMRGYLVGCVVPQ